MSTLLTDWCDFCEGKAAFDKSHFLALFKEHSKPDELAKIFSYFPSSEALTDRAKRVLEAGSLERSIYLLPKHAGSKAELLNAASHWLQEQSRFCQRLGDDELYEISQNAKATYTARETIDNVIQSDIPNNWLFDLIGDEVRGSRVLSTDAIYALFEALYGIAADYYLAWYIGAPLIELDIDFGAYFELWRAGGISVLLQDELLVSPI